MPRPHEYMEANSTDQWWTQLNCPTPFQPKGLDPLVCNRALATGSTTTEPKIAYKPVPGIMLQPEPSPLLAQDSQLWIQLPRQQSPEQCLRLLLLRREDQLKQLFQEPSREQPQQLQWPGLMSEMLQLKTILFLLQSISIEICNKTSEILETASSVLRLLELPTPWPPTPDKDPTTCQKEEPQPQPQQQPQRKEAITGHRPTSNLGWTEAPRCSEEDNCCSEPGHCQILTSIMELADIEGD